MRWTRRDDAATGPNDGPVLIHALDGFLAAGAAPRLAAEVLRRDEGEIVHSFDIDAMYDYRARRPAIGFHSDHYRDYDTPRLDIVLQHDLAGTPYLLLAGPEPDFRWEQFAAETREVIESLGVPLTLGLGAVPMGVPHTRPPMITAHGTTPELVDRTNLWQAELTVPSSAQSMLEYRLSQWGHDAAGYVVHVPHYLTQMEFPGAALALLEAVVERLDLQVDLDGLRARQGAALAQIEEQIIEQDGGELLAGLEQQYDAFARGAAQSLLASESDLPSGDELANQFEEFLARQRKNDQ